MDVLHAPVVLDQFDGEPVEQLGMRRRSSLAAEVEHRRYQRLAEVPRPDVIDRDARRQRMARVGEPLRESGTSAGAGRRKRLVGVTILIILLRLLGTRQRRVGLARHVDRFASGLECGFGVGEFLLGIGLLVGGRLQQGEFRATQFFVGAGGGEDSL